MTCFWFQSPPGLVWEVSLVSREWWFSWAAVVISWADYISAVQTSLLAAETVSLLLVFHSIDCEGNTNKGPSQAVGIFNKILFMPRVFSKILQSQQDVSQRKQDIALHCKVFWSWFRWKCLMWRQNGDWWVRKIVTHTSDILLSSNGQYPASHAKANITLQTKFVFCYLHRLQASVIKTGWWVRN